MRIFITGATGFIGTAVVRELLTAGYEVLGLARSSAARDLLNSWGAQSHPGELSDVESLAAGAKQCDGVIHLAFIHDFSTYLANAETDRLALEAIAGAMEETGKPLVVTSSTAVLKPGQIRTERDMPENEGLGSIRAVSEQVLSAAGKGVRVCAVRLPPSVHGAGDHAFVPAMIGTARLHGFSAYIGDGANRWPAVHRLDAARLFRLALEKATPGSRLHGVAEEGIPVKKIAETIAQGLGIPVCSISTAEAAAHFKWLAAFAALDIPISSTLTRTSMEWAPEQPGLLEDMQENGYFQK
jgi:nucleoside-diphosphate-sugar epimerase